MLSLELELIAILILSAIVGILMGRFLCKSGETEEREKKKQIIHAFKSSQSELELSRERITEQKNILQERETSIALLEQELNNFHTKLHSSDTQRAKLLEELKVLEKYKPRFESLDKEFNLQSKITERLKGEKIANQKEIADFKILTNSLNKQILHLKEKQKELEHDVIELNKRLKQQNKNAKEIEEELAKKYKEESLVKENEHKKLLSDTHQKYQSLLETKEKAYETLEQDSMAKYKEMVNAKEKAYELLEQESRVKYKEMLKSKDEAYEKLHKDSNEKYKEILHLKEEAYEKLEKSKTKAYNELKAKLESIENEYEEFKINYNLDSDRLEKLGVDNEKIYQTLERVAIERDDLIARLRAISSVVGAVGVEHNDVSPSLLESK